MPNLKIEGGWLYLSGAPNRPILDGVWNEKRRAWKIPRNLFSLQEVSRDFPELKEELKPYIFASVEKMNGVSYLKERKDAPGDKRLRPYQRVDVDVVKRLPHAGIFSEMRTGKTPTAIMSIENDYAIVVCPASLVFHWENEIKRWRPELKTIPVSGTAKKRRKLYAEFKGESPSVLIIGYEMLRIDQEYLKDLPEDTAFVCDEAHRLCNHKTAQSKAVFSLSKKAAKRIAITGTPTRNGIQDIWGILHFLYPNLFPGYWQFIQRYFRIYSSLYSKYEIGKPKRLKELQAVVSMVSVSRKREEVMPWLPRKQYKHIYLEMDKKQQKAYESVRDTFEYEDKVDAPNQMAQFIRLRQIALAPKLLGIDAKSPKEEFIVNWLKENEGEQVIIFSTYSSYLKHLRSRINYPSGLIVGETSQEKRKQYVKAFQAGKIRVLLANILSGGTGLTLDNAETVIFLDRDLVPANNDQAEDRIIPVSEERNHSCQIITLSMKDSIDQKVHDILLRKEDAIKHINNIGFKNFIKNS